jgi:Tol biopolymer transport system component
MRNFRHIIMGTGKNFYPGLLLVLIFLLTGGDLLAQGFGRTKPGYKTFEFKVYRTPNFEIYHYFEDDSVIHAIARQSEKWYFRHARALNDTIKDPIPLLIYENHPDFQQTTAVSSIIGIGTGGVTESLKNRVVMPVLETNAQTDHVLGHELVHAFHFNELLRKDTLQVYSFRNLPLWMIEGMAEYLSIGSVDANTAMWMRDAILNDDFPTLKDLTTSYKYFPYRYGHAFWAFVARTWGDTIITPLFTETAKWGYERAIENVLQMKANSFSDIWQSSFRMHYEDLLQNASSEMSGRKLIFDETGGNMNVSPSLSPNGEYVAFFSEKNVFTLDLFIASTEDGKIKRTLTSSTRDTDIDGYNFLESMGTWSPDSRYFAYVAVKKGKSYILIADINRPRRTREITIPGVPFINNPSWSPDGRHLVMTGLVGGRNNLYLYDMKSEKVTRLTNDRYSYAHASWSPDGRYIAFATDKKQPGDTSTMVSYEFNLGIIDTGNNYEIKILPIFRGADNINPVFSSDGQSIYFLSNSDGFRNLYRYALESGEVYRATNYPTGISGITSHSPAISIARNTGMLTYSYYMKGNYTIYSAMPEDFNEEPVDPETVDMLAATLPPFQRVAVNIIDRLIADNEKYIDYPVDSFRVQKYRPKFQLDYIGNTGVGVAVSSYYGTGMSGGVNMLFSDILGNQTLFAAAMVNGEIYDFGGMGTYLNQKRRIKWGGSLSHIPYRFAFMTLLPVEDDPNLVNYALVNQRIFEDQIAGFAYYPFSMSRRLEAGASFARYYYRIDVFNNYYDQFGRYIGSPPPDRNLDSPPGFNLGRAQLAYVGDNSYFGMASPMRGSRYRLQGSKYFGQVDFFEVLTDYRHYYFQNPLSFAVRLYHSGRYGSTAEDRSIFYPLYLGDPRFSFLRGYGSNQLQQAMSKNRDFSINDLIGSRMAVANFEIRLPFTGPEQLAVIRSGFLFTELALFFDAGVAWTEDTRPTLDINNFAEDRRFPFFSTGVSLRVNLFGAMILEPYYAFPFQRDGIKSGVLGLNFIPGW